MCFYDPEPHSPSTLDIFSRMLTLACSPACLCFVPKVQVPRFLRAYVP